MQDAKKQGKKNEIKNNKKPPCASNPVPKNLPNESLYSIVMQGVPDSAGVQMRGAGPLPKSPKWKSLDRTGPKSKSAPNE